jgi:hypothetical protein
VSVLQVGGDFSGFVLVRRGGRTIIYMVLWRRKGAAVQGTAPGFYHFFLVSSDGPKYAAEGETGGGGCGGSGRFSRRPVVFSFSTVFARFWLLCVGSCRRTSISPNLLRLL